MSQWDSYYIGLMSGTSIDGIDAALVHFAKNKINIVSTYTLPIGDELKQEILGLCTPGNNEIARMSTLDQLLGELFAQAALAVCANARIAPEDIKAIGSHGQTIRHHPKTKTHRGFSLQIGDPNIIAQGTGITTITDFRRRDIAAGGHGAPLAPAFHRTAFSAADKDRMVVNLGGIANISYLPAKGTTLGFDSGPANMLMDSWCYKHTKQPYDRDGLWAESGETNGELLHQLLQHPYFVAAPPKSTGRETFNIQWLENALKGIKTNIRREDVQATLLNLTVQTIAEAIKQIDPANAAEVYICGGGAKNAALRKQLAAAVAPRALANTKALGIDGDWVECAAFAWLAKQTLAHQSGNLPEVTGAQKGVILGGIYWGG